MTFFRDLWVWFNAMGTLPWTIKAWAILYPLPQIIGGLFFIQTLPGLVILGGRILSGITASQVHKRVPFSKMMGPIGHAHWLLIAPYLVYELATQSLPTGLYWFVAYVLGTTLISLTLDAGELIAFRKRGHEEFKR